MKQHLQILVFLLFSCSALTQTNLLAQTSPYPPIYSVALNGPTSVTCDQNGCPGQYWVEFFDNNGNSRPRPDSYYVDEPIIYGVTWQLNGVSYSNADWYNAYVSFPTIGSYNLDYELNTSIGSFNDRITVEVTLSGVPIIRPATNVGLASFTANWEALSYADSYRLDVSTNQNFTSMISGYSNKIVSGISSDIVSLPSGSPFYYRVRAVAGSTTTDNSDFVSVYTNLSAPTLQSTSAITGNSFTINWSGVTGASGYVVDVSENVNFSSFIPNFNGAGTSSNNVIVTGLLSGITYWYRVRAKRGVISLYPTESESSIIGSAQTIPPDLVPPVAIRAEDITPASFIARWNSSANAVSYRLDVATDMSFTNYVQGYQNLSVNGTQKLVNGLASDKKYWYRVRSENGQFTSFNSNFILVEDETANQILTMQIQQSNIKEWNQISSSDKIDQVDYLDGFGRPIQHITKNISPTNKDLIQAREYDALGRETRQFLPYTKAGDGSYQPRAIYGKSLVDGTDAYELGDQFYFYQHRPDLAPEEYPYSEVEVEASALGRVIKKGAPGLAWKLDGGHTNSKTYRSNLQDEVYQFEYSEELGITVNTNNVFYSPDLLFVQEVKDENNLFVLEYTDSDGHLICRKVQSGGTSSSPQFSSTYYIYDDLENPVLVLPPEGVEKLKTALNLN